MQMGTVLVQAPDGSREVENMWRVGSFNYSSELLLCRLPYDILDRRPCADTFGKCFFKEVSRVSAENQGDGRIWPCLCFSVLPLFQLKLGCIHQCPHNASLHWLLQMKQLLLFRLSLQFLQYLLWLLRVYSYCTCQDLRRCDFPPTQRHQQKCLVHDVIFSTMLCWGTFSTSFIYVRQNYLQIYFYIKKKKKRTL